MMFYPFDRVHIYVAIFQRLCQGHWKGPHLYLTFKSSHVGTSAIPNGERRAGINHRRRFCPDGSHTSPVLLCLRIRPPLYPPTPSSHRAFGMVAEVSGYGAEGGEGLRASTGQVVSL